jgi:hypothetical protein
MEMAMISAGSKKLKRESSTLIGPGQIFWIDSATRSRSLKKLEHVTKKKSKLRLTV